MIDVSGRGAYTLTEDELIRGIFGNTLSGNIDPNYFSHR
jgi:hypothetical protein